MPNAGLRAMVPPIPTEPAPHGLLSGCVEVVTTTNPHELNGTQVLGTACAKARAWQDCPQPGGWTNPTSKAFDPIEFCEFEPITAYTGIECSALGVNYEESRDLALEVLSLGEQQVLEDFFLRQFLTNATHTVDLTPAGPPATHIVNGIGLLEQWIVSEFGGQGVLHMPVLVSSLLAMHHQVEFPREERGCLTTLAGNTVVLGGGYGANLGPAVPPAIPQPAPLGEVWLYATPAMRVRRDVAFVPQDEEWKGVNTVTNDRRTNAETTMVAELACCKAAAVRVSLSACC